MSGAGHGHLPQPLTHSWLGRLPQPQRTAHLSVMLASNRCRLRDKGGKVRGEGTGVNKEQI